LEKFTTLFCFQLGSAARKIQKYYNNKYAEYGITVAQSFILFSLLENDGLYVKSLAERLIIDSSAITGLVDRLEKENLVERRVDPEDRRAFRIFLTEKGRNLANTISPIALEFNEKLKAGLNKEEEDAFRKFLSRVEILDL
jgi:DNA-binding MarR family transcriptional regulator